MEYLYSDGELYYFMDNDTYEQVPLNHGQVEEALNYIKENMPVTIKFFKGVAFSVEPPNFVELQVAETDPALRAIRRRLATNPRFSKRAQRSWCRCLSIRAK